MDYKGQELAETLANRIILLAALVGLIAGYLLQLFKFTLFIIALGCAIAGLVCVPDWPFYNRQKSSYQWLSEDHPSFSAQYTCSPSRSFIMGTQGKKKKTPVTPSRR